VIVVESGCVRVGGSSELSMYGWNVKASMIGRSRPLALYAVPMSWMKAVGECVSRLVFGRSIPAWESVPPSTSIAGETAFSASYVCASSAT
jgi:hypothetical protein